MATEIEKSYTVWKNLGETPLEALERVRTEEGIPTDVPMTYAGRLDPAAEGLLILLTGEESKNKEDYTKLPKTYMAEIIFGVTTDSYDLLGIPTLSGKDTTLKVVQEYLDTHIGKQMQTYPPYSSKTVDGEQLHTLTRNGTEVELPTHEVELYSYEDLSIEEVEAEDVLVRVGELTSLVTGDFRQEEIIKAWGELVLPEKMTLITVEVSVSSGFYIRQLAQDLGGTLYSLIRTKIGDSRETADI